MTGPNKGGLLLVVLLGGAPIVVVGLAAVGGAVWLLFLRDKPSDAAARPTPTKPATDKVTRPVNSPQRTWRSQRGSAEISP